MQTGTTEFAEAVISLLQSHEMRRNTGMAGAEVIRTRFDWDIIASTLEKYLQEVAGKR